jgi:hypothetical protein
MLRLASASIVSRVVKPCRGVKGLRESLGAGKRSERLRQLERSFLLSLLRAIEAEPRSGQSKRHEEG